MPGETVRKSPHLSPRAITATQSRNAERDEPASILHDAIAAVGAELRAVTDQTHCEPAISTKHAAAGLPNDPFSITAPETRPCDPAFGAGFSFGLIKR